MAEIKELNTRLITRNDTEANWIKNDPVLMPGEIAISISEKTADGSYTMPKFKVVFPTALLRAFLLLNGLRLITALTQLI